MSPLVTVSPPADPVFRVARRGDRPFVPPSWDYAGDDGTFGNRFDDPGGQDGIPLSERFRTIYCASQPAGAFGETLARFRPSLSLIAKLEEQAVAEGVDVETAAATIDADLNDTRDPLYPERRLVTVAWRLERHLGIAHLDPTLSFVDIAHAQTLSYLRSVLATNASNLGLTDIDLSAVTGPHRSLTQSCARHIYEQGFAGVRYLSRLNSDWECWALFDDRVGDTTEEFPQDIDATDSDLLAVAAYFGLTIEGPRGHYIRY